MTDDELEVVDTIDVTGAEYDALRAAVYLLHAAAIVVGQVQVTGRCACGHPTGPGTLACQALRKLSGG